MGEDPWVAITSRYPEGTRVQARVTNLTDYGCFAELEEGVEGLVHVSEMDWTNKNIHPSKVVQVGDEVEVMVLDIDEERRRISLGIKQCKSNPWEDFSSQFNKGDKITGTIKSITDFGIFIGLDGGIDGLVHLSDISGTSPAKKPYVASRRATSWKPSSCRLTQSASASPGYQATGRRSVLQLRCSERQGCNRQGYRQGS